MKIFDWLLFAWNVVLFVFKRVLLTFIDFLMQRQSYAKLHPYHGFNISDWRGSTDGLCPTYTQSHPRVPGVQTVDLPEDVDRMRPSVWHIVEHAQDHMGIVPFPPEPTVQNSFFSELYGRLRSLPPVPKAHLCGGGWLTHGAVKRLMSLDEMSEADTLSASSIMSRTTSQNSLSQFSQMEMDGSESPSPAPKAYRRSFSSSRMVLAPACVAPA